MKSKKLISFVILLSLLVSLLSFANAESTPKPQTNSNITLYVNGNKVSTGVAFKDTDGTVEVPVKAIIEGMGGKYTWSAISKSATIKLKDGTTIILTDGSTSLKVGGKSYSVVTKTVNGKIVNAGKKLIIKNGIVYIPVSAISSYLKYPVTLKDSNLFIGKVIDLNEKVNGVATNDLKGNVDWLVKNLGFKRTTDLTAMYNPIGNDIKTSIIEIWRDTTVSNGTTIVLHCWGAYPYYVQDDQGNLKAHEIDGINLISKKVFMFYLPTKGNELYNMLDEFYSSNLKKTQNLNKDFLFDGRIVRIKAGWESGRVFIYIGGKK